MKKLLLALLTCSLASIANCQGLKTLIVSATSLTQNLDVKTHLENTLYFDQVDIFDASIGTPHVDTLLQYESVLVFNETSFNNNIALGDSLAKYIDLGGGVVDVPYSVFSISPPQGNFTNYQLYSTASFSGITSLSLGPVFIPDHPIMENINSFSIFSAIYYDLTPQIGVDIVAGYNIPLLMVLAQENVGPNLTRRATLNFFPVSNLASPFGWDSTTDGDSLIANALKWVSGSDLIPPPEYCASQSTKNSYEWIKRVELNSDIDNTSGKNTPAYGDYTDQTIDVEAGDIVNVTLTPGYKRRAYREYWRIWADWNYDGDFDDAGEKVFEKNGKNIQSGSFTVPLTANSYDLRLRVSMRWKKYASSCGNFKNGEVEDYTIHVNGEEEIILLPVKLAEGSSVFESTLDDEYFTEIAELSSNPVNKGETISGIVRVSHFGNKTFNLRNVLGQMVKTIQIDCTEDESNFEISTQGLNSGVYFLNVDSDQEATKIIIQ